jgi:Holliday junction resolvase
MASEKNFENKVKKFLENEGCYFIKTHGDRFSKKGTPDLLICCNGTFIGCELKAHNGVASELQKYHVELIKKAGGVAMVLYPKDFEDFKKLIKFLKSYEPIGKDVVY